MQDRCSVPPSDMASLAENIDYGNYDDTELPLPIGDIDLEEKGKDLGIKYFLVSYTPLNADSRATVIPRRAIKDVQRNGCGLTAAKCFKSTRAEPKMNLLPDPKTLIQLPWKPEYGWLASNIYMNGRPFKQCPRRALLRQIAKAKSMGYVIKSGIEPKFMLFNNEGTGLGDWRDARQPLPLQEPLTIMRTAHVIMKICDVMEQLGWEPYGVDHKSAHCQYEINFGFADALTTADRHSFFKFLAKEIAEMEGFTITFMPRPLPNLSSGNGAHVNISLWKAEDNTNVFRDPSDNQLGISKTAYNFIGGLMKHAPAFCAMTCPTVNSYKRLFSHSGHLKTISWGGSGNRTILFRVPANDRLENRLPDGAANPYLIQAITLAAGLDGINKETDPGERIDVLAHCYRGPLQPVPENLLDATRALSASAFMQDVLGQELVEAFVELKKKEWGDYMAQFTKWELDYYINC